MKNATTTPVFELTLAQLRDALTIARRNYLPEADADDPFRYGILTNTRGIPLEEVRDYLPSNYKAFQPNSTERREGLWTVNSPAPILIIGRDKAGWTLDGYVLPRLGSALIGGREATAEEIDEVFQQAND